MICLLSMVIILAAEKMNRLNGNKVFFVDLIETICYFIRKGIKVRRK
jgi:hypothetical protein